MALYDTSNDDSKERLRKEAERDTQAALERERLQKEERERQHLATLSAKRRELERDLDKKNLELQALDLEEDHLDHLVLEARRSSNSTSERKVSTLERIVRDVRAKLDGTKRTEATLSTEIETHKHRLDDDKRRMRSEESGNAERDRETVRISATLRDKKGDADKLEREIEEKRLRLENIKRDIVRVQEELDVKKSAIKDTSNESVEVEERELHELATSLTRTHEDERKLTSELEEQERNLEQAQRETREEEHAEQETKERGRSAAARREEHARKARSLKSDVENIEREIAELKRQGA